VASRLSAQDYKKASESDHIRRDVDAYFATVAAMEAERKAAEEVAKFRALGLEPPGKPKTEAKAKAKGKK